MPHVVLTGDAPGVHLDEALHPLSEERDSWRIKMDELYVERQGLRALVSAVVVEEGHPQSFYILVVKDCTTRQVVIRLDPSTDPIKTRGVKRAIALLAESLLNSRESLAVDRHNLQGYLEAGNA